MKTCIKCKLEQPPENFSKDKQAKSGLTPQCKKCRAENQKKWVASNKEKVKESNRKNREKRKAFYDSTEGIICSRRAHLKRMYGISLEDYNSMLEKQEGKCAICGNKEMNYKNKVLCVDHNHETGQVRGLLCGLCNSGLGKFRENKNFLNNAIKYIQQYEFHAISRFLQGASSSNV